MRPTLIALYILLSISGMSQDKKIAIKLAPLSSVDVINFPAIQGGVEISLSEKWSWYNEFGTKYRKDNYEYPIPDTTSISPKGYKGKTELRYYIKFKNKPRVRLQGYYFAANVFYLYDQHSSFTEYYFRGDTAARMVDNFGVKKTVWATNVLCGQQRVFLKNFLFEYYVGFGVRYRNIKAVNKEFDSQQDELILRDNPISSSKKAIEAEAGKSVIPNLTLGLRLGFRF